MLGTEESARRAEILRTAETLIATRGLRTSLQEIAKAAGILTGSLYHHFASRDALLLELVRRYHADLARVGARGPARLDAEDGATLEDKLVALSIDIAECGVRNRAALQMSFYEAPTNDPELVDLLGRPRDEIIDAMVQTLRAGRWSGYLRPHLDLAPLADRLCQAMLHVGLDVIRRDAAPEQVATVLCRIMTDGLATRAPGTGELDRSAAFAAADRVVHSWGDGDGTGDQDKTARIRAAALKVFGRKSFEVSTLRDIAAEAGVNVATVYRVIGAKDDALAEVMHAFGEKTGAAAAAVMASGATSIEKLDAISWIYINAVIRFPDEWKVQLAWMRHSPPDDPNPGHAFTSRMRQLAELLVRGIRDDEIRLRTIPPDVLARCVIDVLWMPENIIRGIGTRAALELARDTVIRGISRRAG
ncbi:TetR/AcrR family transcriptional regulator [Nocardia sp. BMG111209]|uniref:TetR/AcrR family transcriptional regulator n=1 Tax=Nocardia sp. BMG111209 TaxID=1160137 RepID=UPI00037B7935|nr:TetR/AcrR family transcriptional regulator [Nocardia sp. BMG111209]